MTESSNPISIRPGAPRFKVTMAIGAVRVALRLAAIASFARPPAGPSSLYQACN
jgi:hypothetical protein